MKILIASLFLFVATLSAQPVETLAPLSAEGNHPLLLTVPNSSLAYLPTGSATTQFSLVRVDTVNGTPDPSLSGLSIPLLASVTGSGSHQSMNVATTVGITNGSFFVIDGGTATQEVIEAVLITDSTHFLTTARLSHTAGTSFIRPIYTSFSKFLNPEFNLSSFPSMGQITNWGFIRMTPLPSNVFDQYYTSVSGSSECTYNTYDQPDYLPWNAEIGVNGFGGHGYSLPVVPQYSKVTVSTTQNPTNSIVINAGPITTITTGSFDYGTCVAVQLLFTSTPEPDTSQIKYAYWWDNGNN